MSTPAGGSGEPNKEQDDAVTGGKKQLKLNEQTWASLLYPLNDLHAAAADLSGEDTAEGQVCSPWSGNLQWLDCVACCCGPCERAYTHHTDAHGQLCAGGKYPAKWKKPCWSRLCLPDPTVPLCLQDPREGPQAQRTFPVPATLQMGSLRPYDRGNPKLMQHIQGRALEASQAAWTKLVSTGP